MLSLETDPSARPRGPTQSGEAQNETVFGMIAGDSEGLNRRGNVAVIDFGRSHFLRLLAGTGLRCAPRAFAFEDVYLAKHAQGIDPTAGAPARRRELTVPVPILLVTGFLGAGKTTVVNHVLSHAEGRRIAAVVNDFGAINIDAELIAGASDGVVSLSNGCICCTLEGDLLRTLATLLRRDPKPEFIVIETSGIADPADIVRNLMDPVIWREAPLEAVLCVLDAATSPAALNDDALLRSQLRVADVIALNKVDLADEAHRAQLRDAVRALRPAAVIVEAQHGEVPSALLFPMDADRVPAVSAFARVVLDVMGQSASRKNR